MGNECLLELQQALERPWSETFEEHRLNNFFPLMADLHQYHELLSFRQRPAVIGE
jgi:hypothetical protein